MSDIATAVRLPRPAQTQRMICPECRRQVDPIVKTVEETEDFGGMIVYTGHSYHVAICPVCNSQIQQFPED